MAGMAQIAVSLSTWKAIEAQRLSFDENHDSIIRRALMVRANQKKSMVQLASKPDANATRRRGNLSVRIKDRETPAANLKDAYITILSQLVNLRPSLFQQLLVEGSQRRRWIAMTPEALFPLSPHLARQHAYPIASNWFVDTNLSRHQIEIRLARASEIAGLEFGQSVAIAGQ